MLNFIPMEKTIQSSREREREVEYGTKKDSKSTAHTNIYTTYSILTARQGHIQCNLQASKQETLIYPQNTEWI